ncbi:MAG: hypothetical protein ACFCUM_13130 [Bacteroidales bacterium]
MKVFTNITIAITVLLIIGVSCQKERIFLPEVTAEIIYVYDSIAVATSEVIYDGNADIIAHGFCWSNEPFPNLDNNFSSFSGNINIIDTLKGLSSNTRYYLRAYATNSRGTVYGKQLEFSTLGLPQVRTNTAEALWRLDAAYNRAELDLSLLHDGNTRIDTLGFCYSTNPNPDISDSTVSFAPYGTLMPTGWKSSAIDLLYGTTYYVRAFSTNIIGTSYGEELSFTTLPEPPIEPEETIIIADIQYASYQNNWYMYDNENWRQLVSTSSLILIPKEGIKLEEKDLESIGINNYHLNGPLFDIFYTLTLPDDADHIALALALWDTGWLKDQRFSASGFWY